MAAVPIASQAEYAGSIPVIRSVSLFVGLSQSTEQRVLRQRGVFR